MPVTTVACQSRCLRAKYCTDFAATDFRHQALKTGAIDQTRTRSSQIVVHHDDALETQCAGAICETELEARALLVVDELTRSRLANINDGFPSQTFRRELRVHLLLRFLVARLFVAPRRLVV